jgi:predicted flap endonuclease-1-like 5' DNA nuclease
MITWATDYWYLCLAALLIGIATAAWIWLQIAARAPMLDIDERPRMPAPKPLEPVKPVIDIAEPVRFVAPVPEPVAAPAPAPTAPVSDGSTAADRPAIAAAVGAPDDLTLIKGVGPKLNALLLSLGVTRFDQIAAWGATEIGEVDRFLGSFKGRIVRDAWVEQAGYLARGDHAGFATKFGAVGSENK